MAKTLIVTQRVKELCVIGERKLNASNDLTQALTAKVEKIIETACARATANNRTTVLPRDI